jgi:hypothetical protein
MFERVGAKKTEKGVAVFMRAYGSHPPKKIKTNKKIGEKKQNYSTTFLRRSKTICLPIQSLSRRSWT